MRRGLIMALCWCAAALGANAAPPSAYAGQEARDIKALSAEDVQSYLSGKGLGLAKAAELNGYPGPSHVLALASELQLDADQQRLSKALFVAMEAEAIRHGRRLIDEERKLDHWFATKQITPERLSSSLKQIGALQASVRAAHLEAHLEQVRILSPEQTARYNELRGYASPQPVNKQEHRHH